MSVFKLMREVHETPDKISTVIANVVGEREGLGKGHGYHIAVGPDPVFFMEFWNMKQRGELPPDEVPAVWAVLMRAVNPTAAVRIVLENCIYVGTPNLGGALDKLVGYLASVLNTGVLLRAQTVSKLRGNLCPLLREAASQRDVVVLDPLDAHLLLSACETALVVAAEDEKRWRTQP